MRILISSTRFAPDVGGIETCSELLALEWKKMGHEVTIVTESKSDDVSHDSGLNVIRNPSIAKLFKLVRKSDVYFQNNVSLKTAWPLLLIRKPWFVTTATWIRRSDGTTAPVDHLKKFVLRFAKHIYISEAVKNHVGYPGPVVGNPFSSDFTITHQQEKTRDLVFVGRLVSDKGCDVLIEALKKLKDTNLFPSLSIIGDGPEKQAVVEKIQSYDLQSQIDISGYLKGDQLVKEISKHKIMVVPSLWEEPFGIVALEGMACGCVPIVSERGGLQDAIGECGLVFPNGEAEELSERIKNLITDHSKVKSFREKIPKHLRKFTSKAVAQSYLNFFEEALLSE